MRAIRDRLEYMSKYEKVELIDRTLARFALYVFDLPASEHHHHARPFGLLDHSIEVAWNTVLKLSETSFRISQDPLQNHKERPAWIYCGLLAALGHDAGKVFDCEVVLQDPGDRWDPKSEPLAAFSLRHRLTETGPRLWRFREGRGEHGHKGSALEVLSRIMTPEVSRYVGNRLASVFEHYVPWSAGERPKTPPDPVRSLLEVVRHYDRESARREYLVKKEAARAAPGLETEPPPKAEPADARVPAPPEEPPHPKPAPQAESEAESGPSRTPTPEHPPSPKEIDLRGEEGTSAEGSDEEDGPIFLQRQGDPGEVGRRLEVEFEPARLLDTLRRMILMRRLDRNGQFTPVSIRSDFVWVVFPRAFRKLAQFVRLPFDRRVEYRLRRVLAELPGVVPLNPGTPLVPIRLPAETRVVQAIRFRSRSLFSQEELAKLGYATHEVLVRPGEYRSLVVAGRIVDP